MVVIVPLIVPLLDPKVVEQVAPALAVSVERYLTVLGLLVVEAVIVMVVDVVRHKALVAVLVDILLLVVEVEIKVAMALAAPEAVVVAVNKLAAVAV